MVLFHKFSSQLIGYQISELMSTTSARFTVESSPWKVFTPLVGWNVTLCNNVPLLGGFEVLSQSGYFQRIYESLPDHDMIFFSIRFHILDNWQSTDNFKIKFDSLTEASAGNPGKYASSFASNLCGASKKDMNLFTIYGKVLHNANTLDLKIISEVASAPNIASFGVREVNLLFKKKASGDSEGICYDNTDSSTNVAISGKCTCPKGQYYEAILLLLPACLSCHASCESCYGSAATDCFACKKGYSLINGVCTKCTSPCESCTGVGSNKCLTCISGYWIRWDSTCVTTCDSPAYAQEIIDDFKICKVPCNTNENFYWDQSCGSCPSPLVKRTKYTGEYCDKPCGSDFVDWNGNCRITCNAPFNQTTIYGVPACKLPCPSSEFLYQDGICRLTCPSPYLQKTDGLILYCVYPCDFGAGKSLKWDGSCVSSCTSPSYQRTSGNIIYCDSCQPGYFLFPNNTCQPSCPSPWKARTVNDSKFCYYPCNFAGGETLKWDGNCVSSCNSPSYQRTTDNIIFCDACQPNYFLFPNNTCQPSCISPWKSRAISNSHFCDYPCDFSGGQTLKWNGVCVNSCNLPSYHRTEDNIEYCDACEPNYYFFPNNTCGPDCLSPWLPRTVSESEFCDEPCDFTNGDSLKWDGTCGNSCNTPHYIRTQGSIVYCDSCQPGYFFFPNNTCQSDCPLPWQTRKIGESNFCDFPCDFPAGKALKWDGTCISSCNLPSYHYTQDNIVYCDACQPGYFLYPNNTCHPACNSPWKSRSIGKSHFCDFPCNFAAGETLKWDGLCISSCNLPHYHRTEDNLEYCDSCQPGYSLYPNNTCQKDCLSPWILSNKGKSDFCNYPCDFAGGETLDWNGVCIASCISPHYHRTDDNIEYCDACQPNYFLYPDNSCQSSCPSPWFQRSKSNSSFCDYPCDFSGGQTLKWNGVCVNSCNLPSYHRTEDNIEYCDACQLNYFLYPDNSCKPTCPSPWIQRMVNNSKFCDYPCDFAAGKTLNWNGNCVSSCNAPSYRRFENNIVYCDVCEPGKFFYSDNTCKPGCPLPWLARTVNGSSFCDYPCNSSDFGYWNGSCKSECDFPYIASTYPNYKLCNLPCTDNSQFVYLDGSCSTTCDNTFTQIIFESTKICKPKCKSNEYFYWDSSCKENCSYPLVSKEIHPTAKTCTKPCANPQYVFYSEDSSCRPNCASTKISREENSVKICDPDPNKETTPREQEEVELTNGITQGTGQAAAIGASVASVSSFGNPSAAFLISLIKMLHYLKYMKVNYPPKLEYMFEMQNSTLVTFSFGVEPPENFHSKFVNRPLPGKFENYYDMESSFFINFWGGMVKMILILTLILFVSLFITYSKKFPTVHFYASKLETLLKWNIFLLILASIFDDIAFSTTLEFQTLHLNSFAEVFSFLFCILMNIMTVGALAFAIYVVLDLRRAKRRVFNSRTNVKELIEESHKKWENYQVLYKAYKDDSFYQQIFLFITSVRIYLFYVIIGYLYNFPLLQALLILIMNISMLVYLVIYKPLKEKMDAVQFFVIETILVIVNVCIGLLAIMDEAGTEGNGFRRILGDIVLYCNMILNFTLVVFLAIQAILAIIKLYSIAKEKKPKTLKQWLHVLIVVFEEDALTVDNRKTRNETVLVNANAMKAGILKMAFSPTMNQIEESPPKKEESKPNTLLITDMDGNTTREIIESKTRVALIEPKKKYDNSSEKQNLKNLIPVSRIPRLNRAKWNYLIETSPKETECLNISSRRLKINSSKNYSSTDDSFAIDSPLTMTMKTPEKILSSSKKENSLLSHFNKGKNIEQGTFLYPSREISKNQNQKDQNEDIFLGDRKRNINRPNSKNINRPVSKILQTVHESEMEILSLTDDRAKKYKSLKDFDLSAMTISDGKTMTEEKLPQDRSKDELPEN